MSSTTEAVRPSIHLSPSVTARLARRHRAERRFRLYGIVAIGLAIFFLAMLFISICSRGYTAFVQTFVQLEVVLDAEVLDIGAERDASALGAANYQGVVKQSLRTLFPDVKKRRDRRKLNGMISTGAAYQVREMVLASPALVGTTVDLWVPADDDIDMLMKGHIDRDLPEDERRVDNNQLAWV